MTTLSSDEARAARIEALGPELGTLFVEIENDIYNLRHFWKVYVSLFGTNKERVDLLYAASGETAFWVEKTMFDSAILSICRLTDPSGPRGGSDRNITVQRLRGTLAAGDESRELDRLIGEANDLASFARTIRHKRIAHTDHEVRVGAKLIEGASRAKVADAIKAISAVIEFFAERKLGVHLLTIPISSYGGDEVEFLQIVFDGVEIRNARDAEVQHLLKTRDNNGLRALKISYPDWLTFRDDRRD